MSGDVSKAACLAGSLLLLFALPLAATAATTAPASGVADDGFFSERVDVRAVDVEAVVTDAKDQRVPGLTTGDFRLLVDGKEIRIDSFSEVREGQTGAPASPVPPASPDAGGQRVGTHYLVFLDDVFALASERNATLWTLERDLRLLGPGDRMAIVAYDVNGLTVLSPWTSDVAALHAAFEVAKLRQTYGIHTLGARASWRSENAYSNTEDFFAANLSRGLSPNEWTGSPSPRTLPSWLWELDRFQGGVGQTIVAAADSLRGMPLPEGRRAMLVLSGGWPWDGDERTLSPLTTAANLLGYTLYPVLVSGLQPVSQLDPRASDWGTSAEETLKVLARATGGVAALNRDHSLRQAVEDTRSYYRLGFSPIWKADDRPHDIRVEVRKPKLTVRSRGRFFDFSPATQGVLTAESVLSLGGDPARKRLTVIAGEPLASKKRGTLDLPVTFAIPAEALTLLPGTAHGYRVEGNLAIAAVDAAGRRASLPGRPVHGTLPEAPKPGVFVRIRSVLHLSSAQQRLVVTLTGAEKDPIWTDLEVKP